MTRNQRRQAEKSFNITDYIDGFRKACLNRAKDIRDFASGCDSVVLDEDGWKHLRADANADRATRIPTRRVENDDATDQRA